ncbi:hypothetical protein PC114_g23704 [Phytophthora cactorum]|nr:hypothetical protein PC114_g23704 [Phytophthora cactorum]
MLHDDIALGAATARAPATPAGSHDLASPTSDGEDMLDDRAAAAEPDEVQRMLAPPGRVGGMLPDLPSGGPASSAVAPRTATAAATTAPEATAAAPAVRAAMEHRARAEPAHDHATTARTCAEPMQVDATNSRDSRSSKDDEAPVPATYAHDGAQFACALCQYVAERRSAHRGTRFQDTFTSGCACSLVFYARIVATSHATACTRRQQRAVPVIPTVPFPTRSEVALQPTGPLSEDVAATEAAAAATTQSAVPTAAKTHEHQHAPPPPPVLEPSPVQHADCAADGEQTGK